MTPPPVQTQTAPSSPSMPPKTGISDAFMFTGPVNDAFLQKTATGVPSLAVQTLDLNVSNAKTKRLEIYHSFLQTFELYEKLLEPLSEKALYMRADPLRHPLCFYLVHPSCFYTNKLALAKIISIDERINPKFESLFAVGVDELSWDTILPDNYVWPSKSEMIKYNAKVKEFVGKLILERIPLQDNSVINWESPMWTILMGIEHQRIHLETSSVLIRQLPLSVLTPPSVDSIFGKTCQESSQSGVMPEATIDNPFVQVGGGEFVVGRPITSADIQDEQHKENFVNIYGWDNEYGYHKATVTPFAAQRQLVSNREFYEFIKDGGYSNKKFWSEEGWAWLSFSKAQQPKFWVAINDKDATADAKPQFRLRDTFKEIPLPWDWPVETNALEANAYCRWYTAKTGVFTRLISEDEYKWLLKQNKNETPAEAHVLPKANIGLTQFASSCPTTKNAMGKFYDLQGNVWCHSSTPTYPYSQFKPHPLYDDFTLPTFGNSHNLILGGSWISTGNEATSFSRYAFRRHFFQDAGFRLVQPSVVPEEFTKNRDTYSMPEFFEAENFLPSAGNDASNPYETDALVNQYIDFHYGAAPPIPFIDNFALVCARIAESVIKTSPFWSSSNRSKPLRVLDLGCSTGRTSFELSRVFDQVVGIDFSARFVQVGHQLVTKGRARYTTTIEGDICGYHEVQLGDGNVPLNGLDGWGLVSKIFGVGPSSTTAHGASPTAEEIKALGSKITFLQGDACNLNESNQDLFGFHVVVAANLIDRLYSPSAFLTEIHKHILPGGYLILLSPYTWSEDYTPKSNWVGGRKVDGENVVTKDGLEMMLSPWFELVKVTPADRTFKDIHPGTSVSAIDDGSDATITSFHVPMVIRETHRKHQLTFSECTIWKKRA